MTSYLTIAGSGPSAKNYGRVDIATKKRTAESDYIALRHVFQAHRWPGSTVPLLVYNRRCDCGKCGDCTAPIDWAADHEAWDQYYLSFEPGFRKASSGTVAVFCAVQRWKPETIGLIGFDWILDGNPDWHHDAEVERRAILSLVNIKDLRNDTVIRRIRPPRGCVLPHFLSVGD